MPLPPNLFAVNAGLDDKTRNANGGKPLRCVRYNRRIFEVKEKPIKCAISSIPYADALSQCNYSSKLLMNLPYEKGKRIRQSEKR